MIFYQLSTQLNSLIAVLQKINDEQYTRSINQLSNSSIGGHTRHIIEQLQCAINGLETGKIDYINRIRNFEIQESRKLAIEKLSQILIDVVASDKILNLLLENELKDSGTTINTTYFREIIYNTEHTIHHLALIKVALFNMNLEIVNPDFGMAYSTLKYNNQLSNS